MQDEDADGLVCEDGADHGTAEPDDEDLFDGNTQPPEYYREGLENINDAQFMRKQYNPKKTLARMRYIRREWAIYIPPPNPVSPAKMLTFVRRDCKKILQEDWKACFKQLRLRMGNTVRQVASEPEVGQQRASQATPPRVWLPDQLLAHVPSCLREGHAAQD